MKFEKMAASDYCDFVTDGTHDSPKAKEAGRYLITSKHLGRYGIDFSSAKLISEEDYQKVIARSAVEKWDILFSMIGTIGITYIETNDNTDYACKNMGIFKLGRNEQKSKWLYYYLQTPQTYEYVLGVSRGTTQGYVPLNALRSLPIEVPSNKERDSIVDVLWNLDQKIKTNIRINKNLEEQIKALFRAMFTDNETISNMTLLPLSDLCEVITKGTTPTTLGKPFTDRGINFIKAESISDNHSIDTTKFTFIDADTHDMLKRSIIHRGDILFTIAGTIGRFALVDDSVLPANTNQAVAIIRADEKKIASEYLYSFFVGNWHNDYYKKRIQQAVQANLSLTTIKSLPIPILQGNSMKNYLDMIEPIIAMCMHNEVENRRLTEIRNTLLPRLMSGEIDVSDIEI